MKAETLRRRLVKELEGKGLLRDRRVRDAFLNVPREHFVPEVGVEEAYRDQAILTKRAESGLALSSSSQPGIMAEMLDELRLEPGQRVLEIGAGTGYNAALLKHIVDEAGRVVTVDIDPETATRARRALRGMGITVVTCDGRAGYASGAPYDRIIVTASAASIPRAWRDQLVSGGLLEVPLRADTLAALQLIPTLRRDGERLRSVSVTAGGFMPVRDAADDFSAYGAMIEVRQTDGPSSKALLTIGGVLAGGSAARRLVASVCSEPRRKALPARPSVKGFGLYLILRGPARRVVGVLEENSYLGGLASRDGRSLALLSGWPIARRMLVYGRDDAADELESLIAAWVEQGRPEADDVDLTVSFRDGTSSMRTRFRGR